MSRELIRGVLHDPVLDTLMQDLHDLQRALRQDLHRETPRVLLQVVLGLGGAAGVLWAVHLHGVPWWLEVLVGVCGVMGVAGLACRESPDATWMQNRLRAAFFDMGMNVTFLRCCLRLDAEADLHLGGNCTYLGMEVVSVLSPMWVELYFLSPDSEMVLVRFRSVASSKQVVFKVELCEGEARERVERALRRQSEQAGDLSETPSVPV